jgi:predicted Zn-dependent protease
LSLPGVYERWILTQLVVHYAEMGRNADARKAFERLLQLPDVEPARLAGAYAAVGNKKKALDILKTEPRRINYDAGWFVFLRDEPEFQQLRAQAALNKAAGKRASTR